MEQYTQWLNNVLNDTERKSVETFKRRSTQKGLSFPGMDNQALNKLMATFQREFKNRMTNALLAYYYKVAEKNHSDDVNKEVLEHLGFKPCGHVDCLLHKLSLDYF